MDGGGRLLIAEARLYEPVVDPTPGWLLTEGGRIRLLGHGETPTFPEGAVARRVDAAGMHLLPGFIDLHVHGAVGHEVMDASAEGLRAMARFFARHGVTGFLPSTTTAPPGAIRRAVESAAGMLGPLPGGASILGVHLEGPYLNAARCGAQDPRQIRRADREEVLPLLESGAVRLLALAPEFPESRWLIDECVRRGVTVSIAHTEADEAQVRTAVAHGATQATHTYNAMVGLGHRQPGTVGAVLALPQIRCELIPDGVHVHPLAMRLLVAAKGPERVILVTDARRPAGLPPGATGEVEGRSVAVREGAARLADGTLAGSVLSMDEGLRNLLAATERPLYELWPASSLNAARAIGLAATKGSLEVGKDADLVLLDKDLGVRLTVAAGAVVYEDLSP